jgi:transcriptional regulator with XRE-family HTH domain
MKRTEPSAKWWSRYQSYKDAGDKEGIRRLEFGLLVRTGRQDSGLTQKQAAADAKISRTELSHIENGYSLPHLSNIPEIANAVRISPSKLFKRAGRAVPAEYKVYGKKEACRKLHIALDESQSLAEFYISMGPVWQRYMHEQNDQKDPIVLTFTYAKILAQIVEGFTDMQRLQLARALVQSAPASQVKSVGLNSQRFLDAIDNALAELREVDQDRHR